MEQEKKVGEIREEYQAAADDGLPSFIEEYIRDGRPGVSKLIRQASRRLEHLRMERERLEAMRCYERKYEDKYQNICGIDEVGRGPLAGPVVSAAVILPRACEILYINDSKKLSPQKREALYEEIMEKATAVGIGMASPQCIDEMNILQATYVSMREALNELKQSPDILLNDAVTIPEVSIPQIPIIKGDAKSISIAAASIIAKVTRDRLMVEYHKVMPEYGFDKHKGYGTKEHIEALRRYGASPIHRASFIKNFR